MTTGIFSIQTNKVQKSQNAPLLPKSEREFGNEKLKRKYEDIPSTEVNCSSRNIRHLLMNLYRMSL